MYDGNYSKSECILTKLLADVPEYICEITNAPAGHYRCIMQLLTVLTRETPNFSPAPSFQGQLSPHLNPVDFENECYLQLQLLV